MVTSDRAAGPDARPGRSPAELAGEMPDTLPALIEALTQFGELPALDRARRGPALIEAAKGVLAAERSAALAELVNPAGASRLSRGELARLLGISKAAVSKAVSADRTGAQRTDRHS
jgi:hypothetical protein